MPDWRDLKIAVVDYGMGNLYSVLRACEVLGAHAELAAGPGPIDTADAIILPGVGAFGDAMAVLQASSIADALRRAAESGKPLFGVCLGLQLLMSVSHEFGVHQGLNLIPGSVLRFDHPRSGAQPLKVPQVGWNRIFFRHGGDGSCKAADSPLGAVPDGAYMYFVHSYHVVPQDPDVVLATAVYGDIEFCCGLRRANVFGCQFHPERSGPQGLEIYRRWLQSCLPTAYPSKERIAHGSTRNI
jgi:glutamine amidotransferase